MKTAAQLETAQIGFTTMLGSGEKAQAFLKDLTNFAATTPFELPGLQKSASQLVAIGIDTQKVIPIMTTLGNITSGMGTGSEGIQRAVVAIQQMNAAQKISAEDLNQLRDAGVPVYELLAKATGKSTQEVAGLASAGKLGKTELDALMKTLESGVGLERFNGLMEQQSQSLSGLASTAKDTFEIGMAQAIAPLIPLLKDGLGGATQWLGDVAIPAAVEGAAHFASFVKTDLGPALNNIGDFIRTEVLPPVGEFGSFIRTDLVPGLQNFGGWLAQNKDWLAAIAVTLGTVVAAIQVWSAVTKTITAVQLVFNAVLAANPIGIVIVAIAGLVAGLTWFFTQTELGKQIWANVWGFITTVTDGFVTWFRDTAMPWITGALDATGAVFTWLYENIIKPVFDGISAVVTWVYQTIIKPYFDLIGAAIQIVGGIFSWLYENIVKPVWEGISAAIGAAWNWINDNVFKPIGVAIDIMGAAFNDFWRTVVEPVWNGIRDSISGVWNWVRDNVFNPLSDFIQKTIPAAFEAGKDAIGKAWEMIRDVVKAPIKFVIETIINDGIIKAINTVRGWFNIKPDLAPVALPSGFAGGGYTGDGGKYDPAGIVHAGEFVLTKKQTAAAGVSNLYALAAQLDGYATGGLVSPLSSFVISQGFSGINGHNGIDMAAPTGQPIYAAGPGRVSFAGWSGFGGGNETHIDHPNGLQTWYAHQSGFAVGAGAMVGQGQTIGYVGSTGLSTGPHLHYMVLDGGWPNVLDPTPYLTGGGAPGSGGASFFNPLAGLLDGFLDSVKSAFPNAGPVLEIALGAVQSFVTDGLKWIGNLITGSTDKKGPQGRTAGMPVTVYDGGGWLPSMAEPMMVQHRTRKPDAVLTNERFRDFHDIAEGVRTGNAGSMKNDFKEALEEVLDGAGLDLNGTDVMANHVAAKIRLQRSRSV
ncbi:MAG: peptidoglycan DD-metalloendopeptidase family protein [Paenarthrobacter ureafaciens]|nr:peptidoglycan DD-metalloendopeptidase family protein [Paenarthrobacter ureafaciens]